MNKRAVYDTVPYPKMQGYKLLIGQGLSLLVLVF
jgi:hypothetical protein